MNISPSSGTVETPYLDVSLVRVSMSPAGLGAGTYYGKIQVASSAANSPQVVTVILTVFPAGLSLGPQVFPSGLIFTGGAGTTPGSLSIQIGNPAGQPISFISGTIGSGFTYLPASAVVVPSEPTTVTVYPDFSLLSAGTIQFGTITLQFADGTPRTVSVLIVVAPSGVTDVDTGKEKTSLHSAARLSRGHEARPLSGSACEPLQVQFRSLQPQVQPSFVAVLGQATTVEVQVVDGCGNLISAGGSYGAAVQAAFSNGDKAVNLISIGNGVWTGTWRPVNGNPGVVTLTVTAFQAFANGSQNEGQAVVSGTLAAGTGTPIMTAGGVLQAASFAAGVPVSPGSLITIYGSNLADSSGSAGVVPLPAQLNGAQVFLGNQALPLLYTSAQQMNVQVPYTIPVNAQFQMTVQKDNVLSVPETLVVAAAQPGIFAVNEQGTGQGAIVNLSNALVDANAPASAGDVIVIYCTGLGTVSPAVAAGAAAPLSPLSYTTNTVTATIGGQVAQVTFAGLAPTFAGLYQVNAIVPAGAAPGDAVPVMLQVAGQTSPPVTIAVK